MKRLSGLRIHALFLLFSSLVIPGAIQAQKNPSGSTEQDEFHRLFKGKIQDLKRELQAANELLQKARDLSTALSESSEREPTASDRAARERAVQAAEQALKAAEESNDPELINAASALLQKAKGALSAVEPARRAARENAVRAAEQAAKAAEEAGDPELIKASKDLLQKAKESLNPPDPGQKAAREKAIRAAEQAIEAAKDLKSDVLREAVQALQEATDAARELAPTDQKAREKAIESAKKALKAAEDAKLAATESAISVETHQHEYTEYFARQLVDPQAWVERNFVRLFKAVTEARMDKQVGGTSTNTGTTSLVSKGSVPAALGFAVESGALTRSVSGTTVTFRGNLVGLGDLLVGRDFMKGYDGKDPARKVLRGFSFGVSFDVSRGNPAVSTTGGTPPASNPGNIFSGSGQQFAGYSLRYDLYNHRDPRHPDYQKKWREHAESERNALLTQGRKLQAALVQAYDPIYKNPEYQQWLGEARRRLAEAAVDEASLERVYREQVQIFNELVKRLDPDIFQKADKVMTAYNSYFTSRDSILADAGNKPIFTFEYTNSRPVAQPELHNLRIIAAVPLFSGKSSFTANAGVTLYGSRPTSSTLKRVRDVQVAAQLDVPLGSLPRTGNFVFSLSGLYQNMREPAILMTGAQATGMPPAFITGPRGNLGVFQSKLTIPIQGTGVKIPFSFTWANRTELIKEREIRGNIGITLDLDALLPK